VPARSAAPEVTLTLPNTDQQRTYLPPRLNGGDRDTARIGDAQCERPAPLSDSHRQLLLLGGTASTNRVPARRLEQVIESWLAAVTRVSGVDSNTVSLKRIGWRAAG
jgi:hypothetical protein